MRFLKTAGLLTTMTLSGPNVWAGVGSSLMQVANPVEEGVFEAKIQSDIVFNYGGGLNITAHGVTGLVPSLIDLDVFLGTGATDFQIGAMAKYNILPDLPGQLGLSLNTGYRFMKDNESSDSDTLINLNLFTFGLLTSKTLDVSFGRTIPYASFQVEALIKSGASRAPLSLILGNKWEPTDAAPWSFFSELGLSLRDSHFSLNIGVSVPL